MDNTQGQGARRLKSGKDKMASSSAHVPSWLHALDFEKWPTQNTVSRFPFEPSNRSSLYTDVQHPNKSFKNSWGGLELKTNPSKHRCPQLTCAQQQRPLDEYRRRNGNHLFVGSRIFVNHGNYSEAPFPVLIFGVLFVVYVPLFWGPKDDNILGGPLRPYK